jgi:OmpA-OmpF porin, OOP family
MNPARALLLLAVLAFASSTPFAQPEKVLSESALTEKELVDALAPAPDAAGSAPVAKSRGFRPVTLPGPGPADARRASVLITFLVDSAALTTGARDALQVVAGAMKSERLAASAFTIEGHADPRGGESHNLALSQARASAVLEHLVGELGIDRGRLTAVGLGSSKLLNASNPIAVENRRVTFVTR